MTTPATKKIFISDIHMGDARSFAGPHPYGWCRSNIPHLADFLTEQLNAPDVAEVVILGDLFDLWVIPSDEDPLNSFQAICDNPANSRVMDALRQLAQRGILTYVPGNHDMTLSTIARPGPGNLWRTCSPGSAMVPIPIWPTGCTAAGNWWRNTATVTLSSMLRTPGRTRLRYFPSAISFPVWWPTKYPGKGLQKITLTF